MPRLAGRARALGTLARWLGPWADEGRAPDVERHSIEVGLPGGRATDVRVYHPRGRAVGAYLVTPGLHFEGPDHPRLDRLAAILAAAGHRVYAPYLPDYAALRLDPRVCDDLRAVFEALRCDPACPVAAPGVFSISFGSLPALRLAASDAGVGALVVFGGYADWQAALRFSLTGTLDGAAHVAHDPLNHPVAFLNLLDALPETPAGPEGLRDAWMAYVRETWGRPELKAGGWRAIAERHAGSVQPADRHLFRQGVGLEPGGLPLVEAALARRGEAARFLDPRPHLSRVRCPVTLVHGVEDDVIPYPQAQALAAALPPAARARVLLTGLYDHTRAGGTPGPRVLAGELLTMARILGAMASAGQGTPAQAGGPPISESAGSA